ncbi:MAG: hypothetical protein GXP22_05045 [Gammaproteobacteria bacterium]|nr:hypothetical protein [Gammaproteobacteria bacterium]
MVVRIYIVCLFFMLYQTQALAAEWSGDVSMQWRSFLRTPLAQNPQQSQNNFSLAIQPEFYHEWDNGDQSLTFEIFSRIGDVDAQRNHNDIRELSWLKVYDGWELKAGISKVYWGVTESQHLVDVINQTDFVENLDGEDKLGQPMIQASVESDWGVWDFFVLPGFRERSFSGIKGRPRFSPLVDVDQVRYESSKKDQNIDLAMRWFYMLGDWEIGLSQFNGTSREPVFSPGFKNGQAVLVPTYLQMRQSGLDIQSTSEDWLWKLELISRNWRAKNFVALTAGFEYSFIGIQESDADLGVVLEYLYDSRGQQATSFFQNDVMTGLRLVLNDEQSTEALLGVIVDVDSGESFISLEASRRLGDAWRLELELRGFRGVNKTGLLNSLKRDDYLQLDLAYYF